MFGPVFVRRRPLLRAAVVGGGAYAAGRASARNRAAREQQEASQDQRIASLEESVPAPAPAAAAEQSTFEQLSRLTVMHDKGQLTDAEFTAAKQKLLGI
ncbi:MAG TPA: SHOCT domain-containing protein [Streptosporangiaceae bacterium]|jgi:hypothetical protein